MSIMNSNLAAAVVNNKTESDIVSNQIRSTLTPITMAASDGSTLQEENKMENLASGANIVEDKKQDERNLEDVEQLLLEICDIVSNQISRTFTPTIMATSDGTTLQEENKMENLASCANIVEDKEQDERNLEDLKKLLLEISAKSVRGLLNPNPSVETITIWRNVIITCYNHPILVLHPDMKSIYCLFLMLGVKPYSEDNYTNICITLPEQASTEIAAANKPTQGDNTGKASEDENLTIFDYLHNKQPTRSDIRIQPSLNTQLSVPEVPVNLLFGHLEEYEYDNASRSLIIKKFIMLPQVKNHLEELLPFLLTQPWQFTSKSFQFIYDFLVKFGVQPRKIAEIQDLLNKQEALTGLACGDSASPATAGSFASSTTEASASSERPEDG